MLNLAVIVPMYNPHSCWYNAFSDSITALDDVLQGIDYSIILVNDGSTFFNESVIPELKVNTSRIEYVSYPVNHGKGYAIRYGLSKINADYYIYTDIDFPFGYEVIGNMYGILKKKETNLIIGNRCKEYYLRLPLKRKLLSRVLHGINFIITGFKLYDTQAGIKGIDNKAKKVFLETRINGFLFDLEFIKKCLKRRMKYSIINIYSRQEITFSDFSLKIIKQEFFNLLKIIFALEIKKNSADIRY